MGRYRMGTYAVDGKDVEFGRKEKGRGPYYLYFHNPGGLRGITMQEGRTLEAHLNMGTAPEVARIVRKYGSR